MYVVVTNNSPAGVDNQARRVIDYVGSTKVATLDSNWGTNPSSATTYEIQVESKVDLAMWAGAKLADPTTAGLANVNLAQWLGVAPNALASGKVAARILAAADFAQAAADLVFGSGGAAMPENPQEAPPDTISPGKALMLLYMGFINDSDASATIRKIRNAAGTVISRSTMAETAGVFSQGKLITGP